MCACPALYIQLCLHCVKFSWKLQEVLQKLTAAVKNYQSHKHCTCSLQRWWHCTQCSVLAIINILAFVVRFVQKSDLNTGVSLNARSVGKSSPGKTVLTHTSSHTLVWRPLSVIYLTKLNGKSITKKTGVVTELPASRICLWGLNSWWQCLQSVHPGTLASTTGICVAVPLCKYSLAITDQQACVDGRCCTLSNQPSSLFSPA